MFVAAAGPSGVNESVGFSGALSKGVRAISNLFYRLFCVQLPAACKSIKDFVIRHVAPKKITLCIRPYMENSPVAAKLKELVKANVNPLVDIETAIVNENDPETQKISGPRINLFSVSSIGRLDDIYNMKTLFDKARPGPTAVAINEDVSGGMKEINRCFKEMHIDCIFDLQNEAAAAAAFKKHFQLLL